MLGTVSDNANINLEPHGTASVRIGGEQPTVTAGVGKRLVLRTEDSRANPATVLGRIRLNSTRRWTGWAATPR